VAKRGGGMRAMDVVEPLACKSDVSVAMLGKAGEFVLVSLKDSEPGSMELMEARSRGFIFCGVLGIKEG